MASNVGGIPEIVSNGDDGILVKGTDAEIEAAVETILARPELYGQHARQKVLDRFQESHMVAGTLNVYRKLLGNV